MVYEIKKYSESRMYRRLVSGSGRVPTFANQVGAVRSLFSAARRKALGSYDEIPFVPYAAIPFLNKFTRGGKVIEVGAGMSSCWLAHRALEVTSYEWDDKWAENVRRVAHRRGLVNLTVVQCKEHELMGFENVADGSLDLAFIDGGPRSLCLQNLLSKVKAGGYLYLDNWDIDRFWTEGGVDARKIVDSIPQNRKTLFVDYTPQYFSVSEGLLIEKPERWLPNKTFY